MSVLTGTSLSVPSDFWEESSYFLVILQGVLSKEGWKSLLNRILQMQGLLGDWTGLCRSPYPHPVQAAST